MADDVSSVSALQLLSWINRHIISNSVREDSFHSIGRRNANSDKIKVFILLFVYSSAQKPLSQSLFAGWMGRGGGTYDTHHIFHHCSKTLVVVCFIHYPTNIRQKLVVTTIILTNLLCLRLMGFVILWPLAAWPCGPMSTYFCFNNIRKLTRYHIFRFQNQKGYVKISFSFQISSFLD